MELSNAVESLVSEQPARHGLTASVAVSVDGEVVAEGYGPGFDASTPLLSWSMAKSVTQALCGFLVADGALSLHDAAPVSQWQGADDPRSAITLDNLLRMKSGLRFNEDYVDDATSHCLEMLFGEGKGDMAAYAASQPLEHAVGTTLNYASGTTNIISRMLADRVGAGESFESWANQVLFKPLGIESPRYGFDDAGTWVGSSYLHMTARDWLRFGELYVQGGEFGGTRRLAESWVAEASKQTGIDENGVGYGAHWWIWDEQRGIFAARGYETQRLVVWPSERLVLLRAGKTPIDDAANVDAWINSVLGL